MQAREEPPVEFASRPAYRWPHGLLRPLRRARRPHLDRDWRSQRAQDEGTSAMHKFKSIGKDHVGALLLLALGAAVLALALGYRTGDLNRMGAGFIPVVLGALLMLVGVAIWVTAAPAGMDVVAHSAQRDGALHGPEWRGWICILGGVVAFAVLGQYGGLLPATLASVVVSAMGDRNNTLRGAATLGAILTLFCLIVFHYGLKLQLSLFHWG